MTDTRSNCCHAPVDGNGSAHWCTAPGCGRQVRPHDGYNIATSPDPDLTVEGWRQRAGELACAVEMLLDGHEGAKAYAEAMLNSYRRHKSTPMDWTDYVDAAAKTAADHPPKQQLAQAALGLVGELGEVHDAPPDERNEEAGDCWWYLALAARAVDQLIEGPMPEPGGYGLRGDFVVDPISRLAEMTEGIVYQHEPVERYAEGLHTAIRDAGHAIRGLTDTPAEQLWQANIDKLADRHGKSFSGREDSHE